MGSASVRAILRGHFGWFFAARTVDYLGSSMTTTALALAVLFATGSPGDLGVILAVTFTPRLALMLVGGAVADRWSRRRVLVVTNSSSAVIMGAIATLFVSGNYSLVAVAALSCAHGCVEAFNSPALRGIVPELVDAGSRQQANALLASARNTARIMGPVLGGVLVSTVGGGWALAVDAVSFAVAAWAFSRLPAGSRASATGGSLGSDVLQGWSTFWSMRWVVVMTVSFAVINALNVGPWNVLGPLIVAEEDGAAAWGVVQSARAVGLLAMSIVALRLIFTRPLRDGRVWGLLSCLPLVALGVSSEAWVVALAAFAGGLGLTVTMVTWETALQTSVPEDKMSRVAAYDDLFSYLAIPVSQLAAGPLAEAFGAQTVCLACGVCYAVTCLVPLLNADVRTMRAPTRSA